MQFVPLVSSSTASTANVFELAHVAQLSAKLLSSLTGLAFLFQIYFPMFSQLLIFSSASALSDILRTGKHNYILNILLCVFHTFRVPIRILSLLLQLVHSRQRCAVNLHSHRRAQHAQANERRNYSNQAHHHERYCLRKVRFK